MKQLIAFCGIDCEQCEARLATVRNDRALREAVARKWAELNNAPEIRPEMINCMGCRTEGCKTYYCTDLCPIRQCARQKQVETCAGCDAMPVCAKLAAVTTNAPGSRERLQQARDAAF